MPAPTAGAAPDRAALPLTRDRFEQAIQRRFVRLDTNSDGGITATEWPAGRRRQFARFDTDRDGRVTQAEFRAASLAGFARRDRNHDGTIESDERRRRPDAASSAPGTIADE